MTIKKLIATFAVVILLSGCSNLPKENTLTSSISAEVVNESYLNLPKNISLESVKSAFAEYVNYRLWFYPEESNASQINFTPYIGKEITAEVRMYESDTESIYIHTELGDSLGKIVNKDDFVYLDGFVQLDETSSYPQGNYKNVNDIKINVKTPHKPNYGTSPFKNKMIQAVEKYAVNLCKDFTTGSESDLWKNAKIYIEDFYEYQDIVGVWFVREDGYVSNNNVQLTKINNELQLQGVKGYSIPDFTMNKESYFIENRLIGDAVKQMICNP